MKKFEEDFELARKNSIFEWRITSMTIVDRKDLKIEEAKKNNKYDYKIRKKRISTWKRCLFY